MQARKYSKTYDLKFQSCRSNTFWVINLRLDTLSRSSRVQFCNRRLAGLVSTLGTSDAQVYSLAQFGSRLEFWSKLKLANYDKITPQVSYPLCDQLSLLIDSIIHRVIPLCGSNLYTITYLCNLITLYIGSSPYAGQTFIQLLIYAMLEYPY